MNKICTFVFLLAVLSINVSAQNHRLDDLVFSVIDSIKNIEYGNAINLKGENEKLLLDIYSPQNDTLTKRPLIVFVHGGGFVSGDKAIGYPLLFSRGLAYRGYVSASINYRLGVAQPQTDTTTFEAMYRAVQDAKAAIRFFRKNAAQYNIDTTQIFIMGGSAGAMTALQLAYMDENEVPKNIDQQKWGSLEGTSGNESYSSKVKGVVNCWGAMIDYNWIKAGDAPLFNVHGTADKLVPFDSSFSYHGFKFGSNILLERALDLGIPTGLKSFENSGHTLDNDTNKQNQALVEISHWLYTQYYSNNKGGEIKHFENEIGGFEKLDKTEKYSANAILFTGSSSFRLWSNIKTDLAPHEIIQRGFGGSNISEMAYYINRIANYHPYKAIVFYSGANDLTGGNQDKSPTQILETFKYILKKLHTTHPNTPFFWVHISPNESRWKVWDKVQQTNQLFKEYADKTDAFKVIEASSAFLNADGKPIPSYFKPDKLHPTEEGYKAWAKLIKPYLDKLK